MLLFYLRAQEFNQLHESLELLQVQQWAERHSPENRQDINGDKVGICFCANLFEDFESSKHDSRLFRLDRTNKGHDLLLHRVFIQHTDRGLPFLLAILRRKA